MRFTRYATHAAVVCATLLAPLAASAAPSKEMQDLQRDVALLSDQLTQLQKSDAAAIASLQSAIQQLQDSQTKTNSTVTGLSTSLMQTLRNELKNTNDQLQTVTGLSVKINNISDEVSDLGGTVHGIQDTLTRQSQMISDLASQIKLMQAPAPAPPSPDGSTPAPTAAAAAPPQPSAQTLFDGAQHDLNASRFDLAVSGFQNFLHLYPNDPNAPKAQYNLGLAYYQQGNLDDAVKAYDAAIEQYPPDEDTTPNAYLMKGMALKKLKKTQLAKTSFEAAIKAAPKSQAASDAKQQLTSMGFTVKGASSKKSAR
ncbi:MAG TPA: tetratricopeptide repeat protein [Bryobacteraceae bacterium]|nr:tetratricopeptide repeat protein [Bryobacteraceae bacterium]